MWAISLSSSIMLSFSRNGCQRVSDPLVPTPGLLFLQKTGQYTRQENLLGTTSVVTAVWHQDELPGLCLMYWQRITGAFLTTPGPEFVSSSWLVLVVVGVLPAALLFPRPETNLTPASLQPGCIRDCPGDYWCPNPGLGGDLRGVHPLSHQERLCYRVHIEARHTTVQDFYGLLGLVELYNPWCHKLIESLILAFIMWLWTCCHAGNHGKVKSSLCSFSLLRMCLLEFVMLGAHLFPDMNSASGIFLYQY